MRLWLFLMASALSVFSCLAESSDCTRSSNAGSCSAVAAVSNAALGATPQTGSREPVLIDVVRQRTRSAASLFSDITLAQLMVPKTAAGFKVAPLATAVNACDLNQDGTVNVVDVQLAVDMYLNPDPSACTANVEGPGICNQDVVNRIEAAALGGACVTGPSPHSVTLYWTASTTSNIAGYNLYRATSTGGPFYKRATSLITSTSYTDADVDAGLTYYYVATTVDTNNNESIYSNQATATVPTP